MSVLEIPKFLFQSGEQSRHGGKTRDSVKNSSAWISSMTKEPDNRGCTEWAGTLNKDGYGSVWFAGKNWPASRFCWRVLRGEIPRGLFVCHRCDNRPCVNINHLFLGAARDNVRDMASKGRNRFIPRPGTLNVGVKLNVESVVEIRRLAGMGTSAAQIARRFNISPTNIRGIISGVRWKHVSQTAAAPIAPQPSVGAAAVELAPGMARTPEQDSEPLTLPSFLRRARPAHDGIEPKVSELVTPIASANNVATGEGA